MQLVRYGIRSSDGFWKWKHYVSLESYASVIQYKHQQEQSKKKFKISDDTESELDAADNNKLAKSSNLATKKKDALTRAIMDFIIHTNQPISIAQNFFFEKLMATASVKYQIPSKNVIKEDLIPEMVSFEAIFKLIFLSISLSLFAFSE
jgi:hypothetical protein